MPVLKETSKSSLGCGSNGNPKGTTSFENVLKKDITDFFEKQETLFLNEGDMQINLAVYLMQSDNDYDDVKVEYFVPSLKDNQWRKKLYIDIVVRKGDEYVAIELKYPTKKIAEQISRFGKMLSEKVPLLKEHSAQDIVQYNFWKDVRRLELLKKCFPSLKKGLAILVTNDMLYMKPRRAGIACEQFSTAEGIHNKSRHWNNHKTWMDKGYPDFELDEQYAIEWHPLNYGGHEFIYCIVEV